MQLLSTSQARHGQFLTFCESYERKARVKNRRFACAKREPSRSRTHCNFSERTGIAIKISRQLSFRRVKIFPPGFLCNMSLCVKYQEPGQGVGVGFCNSCESVKMRFFWAAKNTWVFWSPRGVHPSMSKQTRVLSQITHTNGDPLLYVQPMSCNHHQLTECD